MDIPIEDHDFFLTFIMVNDIEENNVITKNIFIITIFDYLVYVSVVIFSITDFIFFNDEDRFVVLFIVAGILCKENFIILLDDKVFVRDIDVYINLVRHFSLSVCLVIILKLRIIRGRGYLYHRGIRKKFKRSNLCLRCEGTR